MADIRRQSTDGRVAIPKIGSHGMTDLDVTLTKVVGARVKLSTTPAGTTASTTSGPSSNASASVNANGTATLEGTVFAACPLTNLIALNTASSPPNPSSAITEQPGNYHIIPISRIHSFQLVRLAGPDQTAKAEESSSSSSPASATGIERALPSIGAVDTKSLESRERAAIARLKEKEASRGRGVTREAQEIFDGLARTLPTRWHDTSIVVNDAVIISKPYTVDDCAAPKDQQNALNRVRKVLEYERKKIADRASKPSAGGPLKGG